MVSKVYASYDINNPPPHPGDSWTRFVCISDNHSRIFPVPPGDVLLHSGDLSSWGHVHQLKRTVNWLISLPHAIKIVIAGNHDYCLDDSLRNDLLDEEDTDSRHTNPSDIETAHDMLEGEVAQSAGIIYLNRNETRITTSRIWKVYGSPASPFFVDGAFQYVRGEEARNEWSRIPDDVQILLTHTPPKGTLSYVRGGTNVGCEDLEVRLMSLRESGCRLHVFGHIHEARGVDVVQNRRGVDCVSVNAAVANGGQAIIVDLEN